SVLAFGSAEGAVVRLENGELLKDRQGGVVVPRVPLQQLAVLARQGGGQFRQAVADNSDLEALVQALRNPQASKGETPILSGDVWQDGAVYLVWLLLPLALWLGRRAAVLMLCLLIYIPPADANSWQQLWQTQQQRAQQAYQQGDYARAREQFQDPLWQGNAAYRAGDYQQAEQAYRQALAQGENASLWHNLGNTLALQQELEQALSAFQRASELDPEHSAARQNAELMQQLLEQQQAEQQAQQQSEEQQEQQSSDSNESSADNASQNAKDNAEEQADSAEQSAQQAEQSPPDESEPQQTDANSAQQAEAQLEPAQDETQETAAQAVINEPWPNATPEQQQELENLLRKVQDDPGVLLRNRMLLEYQKRRHSLPPQGAQQEW
ncbi:MAG: tetratricopeptide repeat protein, partial [Alishewanella aestuarii]